MKLPVVYLSPTCTVTPLCLIVQANL